MKAAEFGNDNSAVKFGNKRIIALFAFCNEKVAGRNSDRRGDTGASGVGGGGNTRLSCGFKIVKKALKYAVFNNNSFTEGVPSASNARGLSSSNGSSMIEMQGFAMRSPSLSFNRESPF